jgi:hypothetical protein
MENGLKIVSTIGILTLLTMSGCAPQAGYAMNNDNTMIGQNTTNNAIIGATTVAATSLLLGGNRRDILKNAAVGAAVGVVAGVVAGQLTQPYEQPYN